MFASSCEITHALDSQTALSSSEIYFNSCKKIWGLICKVFFKVFFFFFQIHFSNRVCVFFPFLGCRSFGEGDAQEDGLPVSVVPGNTFLYDVATQLQFRALFLHRFDDDEHCCGAHAGTMKGCSSSHIASCSRAAPKIRNTESDMQSHVRLFWTFENFPLF